VVRYVGGQGVNSQYKFPAFYPSFEYCNYITDYKITQQTISRSSNTFFGGTFTPSFINGLSLIDDLSADRLPNLRQTLQIDTSHARSLQYYLLIEIKLTKTSFG
jgi:hypothetical protein